MCKFLTKSKKYFDKYFIAIFTFVFSIVLYSFAGIRLFSFAYFIIYITFIAGIVYYSLVRKSTATNVKSLDDSLTFFNDYESIPTKFENISHDVVIENECRLNLSVKVKDKVVASVYLLKWLSDNKTPFGCALEEIALVKDNAYDEPIREPEIELHDERA